MGRKITFEEFRRIIAEELDVDESQVVPEASFVEDLLADSIRLVEMMLRLEEMGITIPVDVAWEVRTVGDAYRFYAEQVGGRTGP
ncbi:MAG TPA: acyl carrier protein [Anaerolineales bacterium]|nr:acyl carrier protein [Anaerolineae bacterium]HIQ02688.1 acyl carrier protein [Anaerolineales bacterium]